MLLSRQLAGFTRGQSDTLRKAMGKKKIDQMNKLEKLFYDGGEKNGHPHAVLNKIWEDWKKFVSLCIQQKSRYVLFVGGIPDGVPSRRIILQNIWQP